MKTHWLKTWPKFFELIVQGIKKFEYRLNDRGFQVGDSLLLREFNPDTETYSGRAARIQVLRFYENIPGMPPGFCIMEIILKDCWMLDPLWKNPYPDCTTSARPESEQKNEKTAPEQGKLKAASGFEPNTGEHEPKNRNDFS